MNIAEQNPFYAYGLTNDNELSRYPVPNLESVEGEDYWDTLDRQDFLKIICTTGHYPTKTDFEIRRRLDEYSKESEWIIIFWLEQKKCIFYYANGINEFHVLMGKLKEILEPIKLALEINVLECTLSKLIHEA